MSGGMKGKGCVVYFGRSRQCRPIWQCALYGLAAPGGWGWGCDARRAGQVCVRAWFWVASRQTGESTIGQEDRAGRGGAAAVVPRARVRGWLSGCVRAWCLAGWLAVALPLPTYRAVVALRCDARQPPVSAKLTPPSVREEGPDSGVQLPFHARGRCAALRTLGALGPRAKVLLI